MCANIVECTCCVHQVPLQQLNMETSEVNRCFIEVEQILTKATTSTPGGCNFMCSTEYPGFSTVCLDIDVLNYTVYFQYRQEYGHRPSKNDQYMILHVRMGQSIYYIYY